MRQRQILRRLRLARLESARRLSGQPGEPRVHLRLLEVRAERPPQQLARRVGAPRRVLQVGQREQRVHGLRVRSQRAFEVFAGICCISAQQRHATRSGVGARRARVLHEHLREAFLGGVELATRERLLGQLEQRVAPAALAWLDGSPLRGPQRWRRPRAGECRRRGQQE
jgi:hypothetical protein